MSGLVPSTNQTKQSYVRKSAANYGVKPVNPAWQEFRNGNFGLKASPTRGRSNDRRGDGQAGGTFLTDLSNAGSIGTELKFKHLDDLLEAALKGDWQNQALIKVATLDTEISDVSTTTLTVAAGGGNFKTGHLTRLLGFPTAGNNKVARVASNTGTSIVYPAATFTAEADPIPVGASVRVVGFQGASGDLVATTTGGNALTSTALDFTTLGNGVGDGRWVYIGGGAAGEKFATAACNGWARIAQGGVAAKRLSFDVVPDGFGADAGTGKTISVYTGDFLRNGTTIWAFDWESQQSGVAATMYEYFYDTLVNGLTVTLTGGKEITVSFDFVGNQAQAIGTVRYAGSTDVAPPTYGTMTCTTNVGDLTEGGVTLMGGVNCMSSGSIKVANNIGREPVVGPLGASATNVGAFTGSGNVDTYLADPTIMAKGINNTLSSFATFTGNNDGDKEGYRWDFPAIRLTPDSEVGASNQARKVSGPFDAEPHPSLGYTMSVGRFWYMP
ncbi:phage tail tube protein [Bradyrhizobium sp.]|uniref:phage tail tube protein n=1 Tax=Bradyrhizobium sp. TaxID=376 RepID=UPI0039E5A8CE